MSDPLDYYDVQAMIRDARYEISRAIGDALRDEFRELIRQERVERQDALESLRRTLDARTERFA